jgi:hypothetical protein
MGIKERFVPAVKNVLFHFSLHQSRFSASLSRQQKSRAAAPAACSGAKERRDMNQSYDFSGVSDNIVKEVHRQAELCLQQTVQIAVAADQRASTLTGILGAGAIALLVASGNMLSAQTPKTALVAAAITAAIVLYLAALRCAQAARSTDYFLAGYEPRFWVGATSDEVWMLRFAAEDLQRRIDANRATLEVSSKMLTQGRSIALLAVPAGLAAYLLSSGV